MASSAAQPPSAIEAVSTGAPSDPTQEGQTAVGRPGNGGRASRPASFGRRLFRWFIRGLLVLVLVLAAGVFWLGSESGLNFALSRTQKLLADEGQALAFEQLDGSLWRGIRLGRFEWRGADMMVKGDKLRLRLSLKALLNGRVALRTLGADSLVVQLPPASDKVEPRRDVPMPGDVGLPLSLEVNELDVKRFELWPADVDSDTLPPTPTLALDDIKARLGYTLGQYEIESLSLNSPWGHVESVTAQLDATPPHRLKAAIHADGTHQQWPYEVDLIGTGSLAELALTLNGQLAEGQADIRAVLKPLDRMPLLRLRARIADADLRRFVVAGVLPETGLDLDLDIEPEAGKRQQWQGQLRLSNRLSGPLAEQRLPLRQLRTELQFNLPPAEQWADAFFRLKNLSIGLPASPVPASEGVPGKTVARADGRVAGQIEAWWGKPVQLPSLDIPTINADLSVNELDLAPWVAALPSTALKGQIQLDGQKFLVDLVQTAAQMRALLPEHLQLLADNAQLKLAGSLDEELLRLREIKAVLGESRFSGGGQVTVKAPHQLRVGGGLRNIDLARWVPADLGIDPAWREGNVGADWLVTGRLMAPEGHRAELKLNLLDSHAAGQPLTGSLRLAPVMKPDWQLVSIEDVLLKLTHGPMSEIQAQGALGRPQDKLSLQTRFDKLAAFDRRLQGQVSLKGELKGKLDDLLASVQGQGADVAFQQPDEQNEPQITAFKSLALNLEAPLNLLKPQRAEYPMALRLGLQKLQVAGQQVDGITLNLKGQPREHALGAIIDYQRERLQLNAVGGVQQPRGELLWKGRIDLLDISGALGVRLEDAVPLTVNAQRLDMGMLNLGVLGGKLKADHLKLDWAGPLRFDTTGSLNGLVAVQLREILGLDSAQNLGLLQDVRADALWSLKGQGADALHGEVKLAIREEGTGLNKAGRLGLRRGNGAVLRFNGRALDGKLHLDLPSMSLANIFLGTDLSVDGRLKADGSVTGTIDQPKVDLALAGEDMVVLQRSAGMRLSGGELNAHLTPEGLRLKTLRFRSGDGSLNVSGVARLVERAGVKVGEPLPDVATLEAAARKRKGAATRLQASVLPMDGQFDVVLDRFRVPVGPGQRVTVSGQTQLISSAKGLFLGGGLKVDEGLIEIQGSAAPSLPDDVSIADTTVAGDAQVDDEDDAADTLRIASNLGVDLGQQLRVTGLGVDARLGGRLTVLGFLPGAPKLTGAVQVLDGSYEAYGQNLRITKGFVRFNGPIQNPSLDIEATRPFLPVEVGVSITGQVAAPQVVLISKPSMPETTKLSWLVLGVPPEQAGGAAQMLALQQAGSLLLGNDGSHSPSIAERLGLDVFNYGYASDSNVEQGLQESLAPKGLLGSGSGDSGDNTETGVISLGKRINDRLFVSYEKGVRGVWSLLRIQYTLGRGFVLRGQTGSDNSVDLLRSITFD